MTPSGAPSGSAGLATAGLFFTILVGLLVLDELPFIVLAAYGWAPTPGPDTPTVAAAKSPLIRVAGSYARP